MSTEGFRMASLWPRSIPSLIAPYRRAPAQPNRASPLVKLASHMDIAWDLDGTLIGHQASAVLHRFIRSTPRIRHVIVTFRTPARGGPWRDLAQYPDAPGQDAFADVVFAADDAADGIARAELSTRSTWRLGARDEEEARHTEWKGRVCNRYGLTALVDDKPRMVSPGCRRFGIELFHPQDFLTRG